MRTLDLQFQLTKAEWEEAQRAFLSPAQQIQQAQVARFFRRVVACCLVLAGLCLIAFAVISPALLAIARLTAPPYLVILTLYLVGPFLLNQHRTGGNMTHFAFMDQGWRHFTTRSPIFPRPYSALGRSSGMD